MLLVACSTRSKTQCLVNLLVHGYLKHLEKKRTQSDKKEKSQGSILTKQKQTNKQTNEQTNKRTNKQTNKQTATAISSATTTTTYPVTNFLSLVVVQKLYFWESVIKRCWNVRANKIAVINHGSISLLDGFRNV